MRGTYSVVVGDEGGIVVPAEVRERARLMAGTTLVLVDAPDGIVLLTRNQLRGRVKAVLADVDLVGELLADRRRGASDEDATT